MKRVVFLFSVLLMFSSLIAEYVFADSLEPCTYRPLNKNEQAFFSQFSALRTAVSPAPEGWTMRDNEKMDSGFTGIPQQVCAERPEHELSLEVSYERTPDMEKEEDTLRRAQNAMPDPAELAKIEKLQAKQLELVQQATIAAERGDMNAVDRLNTEIDALVQQIQQMFDAMYAPQSEIAAELERDRTASLSILVNGTDGDCIGNPLPMNIPGAVAYRCSHDDGYTSSGQVLDSASARILIVLGQALVSQQDWPRLGRDQREFSDNMITLKAAYDPAQPLMVQNVVIRIDSDNPERADSLYQGLRLDMLKKLLRH